MKKSIEEQIEALEERIQRHKWQIDRSEHLICNWLERINALEKKKNPAAPTLYRAGGKTYAYHQD